MPHALRIPAAFLLAALIFGGCSCSDEDAPGDPAPGQEDPDGGDSTDGGDPDAGEPVSTCAPLGTSCAGGEVCCTGVCTPNGLCENVEVRCAEPTEACADNTDCCLGRCTNGTCAATRCEDNGAVCGTHSDCCTANCSSGTCAAIPGVGGGCKVQGQACGTGGECCSTNCKAGFCAAASTCRASNDLCFKDTDCCSSLCSKNDGSAGFCRTPSGGCIQDGLPCSNGTNCCSRVCADPGTGVTVCQAASGCRMTGSSCIDAQACCGGGTNPNQSVQCDKELETDTFGRCDNGQSCNPVGNICGAPFTNADGGTFSVNASQNCCDGRKDVCKLDSAGIPRCYGGGSTQCPTGFTGVAPCCIAEGQLCQFSDQCCDGSPCVPNAQGILQCTKSTCVPLGATCTGGAGETCCSGSCLPNSELSKSCQLPSDAGAPACKANGSACSGAGECCSTICSNGTCAQPQVCQPKGAVCTVSGDCCTGLSCQVPSGSTSGACQEGVTCAGLGQSCSSANPCCNGAFCGKDTNGAACDDTTACSCRGIIN